MLSEANFLILDEPTNHLDITSKEILEQALNDYTGTVLYVSHDRYFINQTATRILDLVNRTFVNYIGNYDYYLDKKEELTAAYAPAGGTTAAAKAFATPGHPSGNAAQNANANVSVQVLDAVPALEKEIGGKASWQEQKEQQARERKRKNDLKKIEERISLLEEKNLAIDELLTHEDVYSNSVKCQELVNEKIQNEEELENLYEQWECLEEQ
jgi:ATP-binding cassette subfamily F protein 3